MAYKKLSLSPGTLVYTGSYIHEPLKVDVFQYDGNRLDHQYFDADHIHTVHKILAHTTKKTWVNVVGLNDIAQIEQMGKALGLDLLHIEDILNIGQRSKIEIEPTYALLTLKMLMKESFITRKKRRVEGAQIRQEHVTIIMKNNMIVTFQENEEDVFNALRHQLQNNTADILNTSTDYWVYMMLDAVVDHQLALMSDLSEQLDNCEIDLLDSHEVQLQTMYQIRKWLLQIKSSVYPLKDIIFSCLSIENNYFTKQTKTYLRDVDDHLNHLIEQLLHNRDMIANLFEMNATEASNRMNRVMTTLTVFSAVFIPLNFLAGFFGMNFKYFAWLEVYYAIPIFIATCSIIALILLAIFKKMKWIF